MNIFLLKLLDLFAWLFKSMKVDYDQLRAIVAIKLTMDNRRQGFSHSTKSDKESNNTFAMTLLVYGLFGIFVSLAFFTIPSLTAAFILFFTYIMVMIAMTLITDFSSILLDTSDNTIVLPRPVDGRTLFTARIVHIMLYLAMLTTGLSTATAFVILLKHGFITLFLFMPLTALSVLMAVLITNALYLLIIRFADEEKLKSIINYFQIGMAIFFMAGYQLLPRLLGRFDLEEFEFEIEWWSFLLPPVWMAGTMEAYLLTALDIKHIILVVLAVSVPLAGFYFVNRYLTPVFNKKLASMGAATEIKSIKTLQEKPTYISKVSGWISNNPIQRSTIELIYLILGRDRKIKLKIYPSFGYLLVFGLIFMVRGNEDIWTTLTHLPETDYYIVLIYLAFMIVQVAFHEIPYSDDHKASWLYMSAPISAPGEILLGTLKAIFLRLFIPAYLVISVIVVSVWGIATIDDIVFGFFNNFMMLLTIAVMNKKLLPLTVAPSLKNQSGNLVRSMLMIILLAILGFGHYLLTHKSWILLSVIPLQVLLITILMKVYKKTQWKEITL
jgi:hypothetical protein